jgi:aspartokinase
MKSEFEEISDYEFVEDKVLVTLVGSDLGQIESFEQRIFQCSKGIKADSVIFGFNKHSFALLVNADDWQPLVKNLHKEFFEKNLKQNVLFQKTGRRK